MRILLVNPYNVGKFGLQNVFQAEPLGLEIIAGSLRAQHDVRITDLRWEPDFARSLRRFEPDLVGISCLYASHTRPTWRLAHQAKQVLPGCKVVVGGQPPSLGPTFFESPDIDAIVVGDGEDTMPELTAALERGEALGNVSGLILNFADGQVSTGIRATSRSFDHTPTPDRGVAGIDRRRHYMSFSRPLALMEISRGCPYRCNFCSIWKFAEGRVRSKTIDAVIEELGSLEENAVFFVDDHFFANPHLMLDLGRALADANLGKAFNVQTRADTLVRFPELIPVWKRAGWNAAFLGLEGHSAERLTEVNKSGSMGENETAIRLLQDHGIGVVGNLMVDPGFSEQDFDAMKNYVKENNYFFAGYCISTPFPGTETWEERRKTTTTLNFDLYDIQHAVTETRLPLPRFYERYAELWSLRRAMQPATQLGYKLRRVGQMLFKEGLNFELLRNVRRFDRQVCDPAEYLDDHRHAFNPWTTETPSFRGNLGNTERVAAATT